MAHDFLFPGGTPLVSVGASRPAGLGERSAGADHEREYGDNTRRERPMHVGEARRVDIAIRIAELGGHT